MSASRKQRRMYEKFLKKLSPTKYAEWKSQSKERGEQLHKEHIYKIQENNG